MPHASPVYEQQADSRAGFVAPADLIRTEGILTRRWALTNHVHENPPGHRFLQRAGLSVALGFRSGFGHRGQADTWRNG
jgi:hypothetical protein